MFGLLKKKRKAESSVGEEIIEDFSDVDSLVAYFKDETGIDFFNRREIIKNKLILFCKKRGIHSFFELLFNAKHDRALHQELVDYLSVNETYFFRETPQIEDMIEKAKRIDSKIEILSAPSSSGEEPYTIAIMMLEAGFSPLQFHIVGIDISEQIIDKAREARYGERSLHRIDRYLKNKYFIKDGDGYLLKERVKDRVSFRCINIFDETIYGLRKFDFIFSRNMMIYFDYETKIRAKNILQKLLKRGEDCLYFGHADMINQILQNSRLDPYQ